MQRGDGLDRVGAADRGGAGLGQAEVPDLAGGDEFSDRAGDIFDGNVGVDAVLVEKIYDIGPQASQRAFDGGTDALGPTADAALVTGVVEGEAELRRDDDSVPGRLKGLTHNLLVHE